MTISAQLKVSSADVLEERVYTLNVELPAGTSAEQAEATARTILRALSEQAREDFPDEPDAALVPPGDH